MFIWDGTRNPVRESFTYQKVELNGREEDIACFNTMPFNDVDEYRKYKKIADTFSRLITKKEWDKFYQLLKEDKRVDT